MNGADKKTAAAEVMIVRSLALRRAVRALQMATQSLNTQLS
jgi:hypothetical protein